MSEQTLNIPQIIAVVLVGFLAIRWFLSPSSSSSVPTRQINPAHADQILSMFPQLDRRTIMWDLQRNGGSVQATTERVLNGRALDNPPPSFQPQMPQSTPAVPATTASQGNKAALPDLITRYNLSSRVTVPSTGLEQVSTSVAGASTQQTWSQSKTERSEQLKRRREDMILAARRKFEEKDKQRANMAQ